MSGRCRRAADMPVSADAKRPLSEREGLDTILLHSYLRVMKNVTVTLPEETARWVRVRAAEQDRSVSSWLAELVDQTRRREDAYEVAMASALAREPCKVKWVDGRKPTREELHDRTGLR